MKNKEIYQALEDKMLGYSDYANIPLVASDDEMSRIIPGDNLTARQIDPAMSEYTGAEVYVRNGVLERLEMASDLLAEYDENLCLEVVYGYRALRIQTALFEKYKKELEIQYTGQALLAATHRLIAVPELAGHPAGAAVDLQITRSGEPLDFGTAIWQFVPDSYTFSPFISKQGWENRRLLRHVMLVSGFAPFDGEWWHFSYGDKEWARYYSQRAAIYGQLAFSTLNQDIGQE